MELTPQSTRSPTSPFRYTSNPQPLYEYPSPARSDSRYRSTDSLQGLGLYSCPLPGANGESDGTVIDGQSPSATNNNSNCNWPTSGVQHRDTTRSSHSTPNILSAEYDPFAPFHPTVSSAPFSHDIYSTQTAEVTILPASPLPSGNTSQRSSFSSAHASEIFTQAGSIHSYTPRIKMEDHTDYASVTEAMLMSSPQLNHNLLVTASGSYPGSIDTNFYPDQGWSKMEYGNAQDLPSISSLPIPHYERRSESQDRGSASGSKSRNSSTVTRTRQPRRLTTKEDANFQCHVKGCEKFFGRSYNFKAHMETHDAGREYPFPCPVKDCTKKFVRKTDLQRHHQSVHMKQKNHRCDYCSRYFARKDTLRRHVEDGCSKRFDINVVDFRPQGYSMNNNSERLPSQSRASDAQHRQASYSSSGQYSPPPTTTRGMAIQDTRTSSTGAFLERQDYLVEDATQDSVWTN